MADGMTGEKKALRREMLARRRAFSAQERAALSEAICARALDFSAVKAARTIMLYASTAEEIDLYPLMEQLLTGGRRIALPEIVGSGVMEAQVLPAMDALTPGAFGILTPDPARGDRISPEEIDVIIVPGAAFDADGGRLGLGGGYYDRFLPRAPRAVRLVLAYDVQIVPHVPMGAQDVRVDAILSERRTIFCKYMGNHGGVRSFETT